MGDLGHRRDILLRVQHSLRVHLLQVDPTPQNGQYKTNEHKLPAERIPHRVADLRQCDLLQKLNSV